MNLPALIRKRGTLKRRITDFNKLIDAKSSAYPQARTMPRVEILQITSRLNSLETIINDFEIIQEQIDELSLSEDPVYESDELELFENSYFEIVSRAKQLLEHHALETASSTKESTVPSRTVSTVSMTTSELNLPSISLPKFCGEITKWLEYRDMFEAVVGKSTRLSDVQKFYYLKASLSGDAAKIIGSLQTSADNYEVAWKIVCDRYENKKVLIQTHVQALFNVQHLKKESASSLRQILDTIEINMRALNNLGEPTDKWDTIVIVAMTGRLDEITQREWENHTKQDINFPSLDKLKEFLYQKAIMLDNLNLSKVTLDHQSSQSKNNTLNKHSFKVMHVSKLSCYYCKAHHSIYSCKAFQELTIDERWKQVERLKLCVNCLRTGHKVEFCRSNGCKTCQEKHNTYLHKIDNEPVSLYTTAKQEPYLIPTVNVQVLDDNGFGVKARGVLDSAATHNFISKSLAESLGVSIKPLSMSVSLFSNAESKVIGKCTVIIKSNCTQYKDKILFYVATDITSDLPLKFLTKESFQLPTDITLADPNFYKPGPVDILLGSGVVADLLTGNSIKLGTNRPKLLQTELGWVVLGKTDFLKTSMISSIQCNLTKIDCPEEDLIARFWELEECTVNDKTTLTSYDFCETHFQNTYERTSEGRFVVSIPFSKPIELLGDSEQVALDRFLSCERKLQSNSELKNQYVAFIHEYEHLGHMCKANLDSRVQYFLPHHGVINESSTTTRLRVVFDASHKTTSGYSLNCLQAIGPTIQQDIFSILCRFRQHTIAVTADVSKMYRQIKIKDEFKPLHQIFWRDQPSDPLLTYQLNTVTYGTASAPFLAIRCLHELGKQNMVKNRSAAEVILNDFYVDDMLSGGENVLQLANDVTSILASGCFPLRKFNSNCPELLHALGSESQIGPLNLGENEQTKTLGLYWDTQLDCFIFKISNEFPKRLTKRSILSYIGQIFDPLGLLGACTVTAKVYLQSLWQQKVGWDDVLPESLTPKWVSFQTSLIELNSLSIPRCMLNAQRNDFQLHGFADASEKAYGACVYIKSSNNVVNLIASKSRVAPLKSLTVPRLELCAALLLTKLNLKILESLKLSIHEIYLWSDSTIVLHWIKKPRYEFKQFVANRVGQIQDSSKSAIWRYVPTKSNPADLVSRGITPSELITSSLWWHGPSFLTQSQEAWPENLVVNESMKNVHSELKSKHHVLVVSASTTLDVINRFSSLPRAKRVIAYCLRFINKVRKNPVFNDNLHASERQNALLALVKGTQLYYYPDELTALTSNRCIKKSSKILSLNPFIDDNGLLRVGGRLQWSDLSEDQKHSIILPPKCTLSKLLFENEHVRLCHAGPVQLLNSIRDLFWPIHGRSMAKKVVKSCIGCFRANPINSPPIMGSLPRQRVTISYPFVISGVDYAGPVSIKRHRGRKAAVEKVYICLFICFSTKAVHIELVADLTSDAFIAALHRFISRRGKPREIHSDNGTNFVGANKELSKFLNQIKSANIFLETLEEEGIKWNFIPPSAPHFGGLWEINIKRIKFHLRRVIGDRHLTYDEFLTLTCQIECVLNSRPITTVSDDANDLEALTPAHFLIGRQLTSITEPRYCDLGESRCSAYQKLQRIFQHFWYRWSKEYLSNLQVRSKWQYRNDVELKVGDLVIVKDELNPPLRWPLGRVETVYTGRDGIVRVADVRLQRKIVKRPVIKLFRLPLEEEA